MNRKGVLIIAEAGVNHNCDIGIAKRMIDCAKEAGADVVKFQTGLPHNVISKHAPKATYQKSNISDGESQLEMANQIAFEYDVFAELKSYCQTQSIEFLSTPFDIESADYLHDIGVRKWKIPSGEITNLPYLEHIACYREPIFLSTGMSSLIEVKEALCVLHNSGAKDIVLLHCTTNYPTEYKDVNLNAMLTLKNEFCKKVGYSDHTLGIDVPIAAVAMGARVIEKHFTLDRNMPGPDHKASLEPNELMMMIKAIRNIETAMGDGIKEPRLSEIPNKTVARKSIVAKKDIKKGELFTIDNLTTKRPGNGVSPMKWYDILGTRAKRDYQEDDLIDL